MRRRLPAANKFGARVSPVGKMWTAAASLGIVLAHQDELAPGGQRGRDAYGERDPARSVEYEFLILEQAPRDPAQDGDDEPQAQREAVCERYRIEAVLDALFINPGPVDGIIDDRTSMAITQYAVEYGYSGPQSVSAPLLQHLEDEAEAMGLLDLIQ